MDGLEPSRERMFTLFRQAISTHHLAIAHMVLNWQPDIVYYKDDKDWTPLHLVEDAMQDSICNTGVDAVFHPTLRYAVRGGFSDALSRLHGKTSESIDLNDVDEYGNTPLHIAARDGKKKVVKTILEQNEALANVPGENGYLPIQLAVMGDQPTVVELLGRHCDAKGIRDRAGYTLLHLAAKHNCAKAAKQLLCDDHRPDTQDQDGYCPIHVAALNGSTAVIQIFLQYDIGMIALQGANGSTVLHCAAKEAQVDVVELICNTYPGAISINAVNDLGETPLHSASISTTPSVEVIRSLCKFGAEGAISNYFKDIPLHSAIMKDDEETARALLSANPKLVDMAGASGEVPLHWAVKKSSSKMIDVLCEANCDVNAGDQYGNTPLHFAISSARNEAIVQQLLAKGAAPEKPNHAGLTPLDLAATKDAQNCFRIIHDEAQKTYRIDKVFHNMQRAHRYVRHGQMDKAGKLLSEAVSNVQ